MPHFSAASLAIRSIRIGRPRRNIAPASCRVTGRRNRHRPRREAGAGDADGGASFSATRRCGVIVFWAARDNIATKLRM